jgi:hypothetical protein
MGDLEEQDITVEAVQAVLAFDELALSLHAILDEDEHGHAWEGSAKLLADKVRRVIEEFDPTEKEHPEVIRIIFTLEDVFDIASDNGVSMDIATERALEWGRHIADTMTGYCWEQLSDAIITGTV